jgi:predicted transcriptional regulator YheO
MSHLERLGLYDLLERIANGIVAVMGAHCEVVIHDFSNLDHSAVIIAGNVSGRVPGAPVPDIDFISQELSAETPDQLNYRIQIADRELQSSTVWVRDEDGTPIGAVCINFEYSDLLSALGLLNNLTAPAREKPTMIVQDTLARDLDELIDLSVSAFLRQEGIPSIEELSQKDRSHFIEIAEERGLFNLRGSAQRIAEILNVSRASIYNYRARYKEKVQPESD